MLVELNARAFKKLPGSRRSSFETMERAALQPLPPTDYPFAQWKPARVGLDYHVEFDAHDYSVPHALARSQVDVRATSATVEVFHRGRRVAAHARTDRGGHTRRGSGAPQQWQRGAPRQPPPHRPRRGTGAVHHPARWR